MIEKSSSLFKQQEALAKMSVKLESEYNEIRAATGKLNEDVEQFNSRTKRDIDKNSGKPFRNVTLNLKSFKHLFFLKHTTLAFVNNCILFSRPVSTLVINATPMIQ